MRAKDDADREIAERDVGRKDGRPPLEHPWLVEPGHDRGEQRQRRQDQPQRRDRRRGRPAPGVEHAAGRGGFDDFLGDQAEEQHHAQIADPENKRTRHREIALGIGVDPDERDGRAYGQHHQVFSREMPPLRERAPWTGGATPGDASREVRCRRRHVAAAARLHSKTSRYASSSPLRVSCRCARSAGGSRRNPRSRPYARWCGRTSRPRIFRPA